MDLGQEQIRLMLNAAWVRVLYNGEYRSIIDGNNISDVTVNIADCLPTPNVVSFPDISSLECNAKHIITNSHNLKFGILFGNANLTLNGIDTTAYFGLAIPSVRNAIIHQINMFYNISINIELVTIYPFEDFTELLNDGKIDILDQLNALGGSDKQNIPRSDSRLFTCTLIASMQYFMVLQDSLINTINDVIDLQQNVRICVSSLSTNLMNAYFPLANITTILPPLTENGDGGDIKTCILGLVNNEFDLYGTIFPSPDHTQFEFDNYNLSSNDFRQIATNLAAGTPYWIARNLRVNAVDTNDSDTIYIVAIIAAVLLVTLLFVVCGIYYYRKKKSQNKRQQNEMSNLLTT